MTQLSDQICVPCSGKDPALTESQYRQYLAELPQWEVQEEDQIPRIQRTYKFQNFAQALDFTNHVGKLAEDNDHHPAILTEWGKVTVTWWTHKIRGLHQNDFVMAAKTDRLYER